MRRSERRDGFSFWVDNLLDILSATVHLACVTGSSLLDGC